MTAETSNLGYTAAELSIERASLGYYLVRLVSLELGIEKLSEPVPLDTDRLACLRHDLTEYGRDLGKQVFGDIGITSLFNQARGATSDCLGLRLRLRIPPELSELHRIAWETMCFPGEQEPLSISERVVFSRWLGSDEVLPSLPNPEQHHVLVAVANPTDSTPVDTKSSVVFDVLSRIHSDIVTVSELRDGKATLDNIISKLRLDCDMLYLTCHGMFHDDAPIMLLENHDGSSHPVGGREFADAIRRLARRPSLVILASCSSAGDGAGETLAAIGPMLVQAGVPAVIAMQGEVQAANMERWGRAFWQVWSEGKCIDCAMAAARWALRETSDWWLPVLWENTARNPGYAHKTQRAIRAEEKVAGQTDSNAARKPLDHLDRKATLSDFARRSVDWVCIGSGTFTVTLDGDSFDKFLSQYWIARTPITNRQYLSFVRSTGHRSPEHWVDGQPPADVMNHPVVNVSWFDAKAFCAWAGVDLPNEAQWEKAARGKESREYPWGNEPPYDEICNFGGRYGGTTDVYALPGGSSPFGCVDMVGNVWEWTNSIWTESRYTTKQRIALPKSSERIVVKGGSFADPAKFLRCQARVDENPKGSARNIGFRVITAISPD